MARELASVITNRRWADRIASAQDTDELTKAAFDIFRAALAKCRRGPEARDTARLHAARTLVELTAELER